MYTWSNPYCCVHNIILGKLWIEQYGTVEIVNHRYVSNLCAGFSFFLSNLRRSKENNVADTTSDFLRIINNYVFCFFFHFLGLNKIGENKNRFPRGHKSKLFFKISVDNYIAHLYSNFLPASLLILTDSFVNTKWD